jgi:hypothetical protein
MNHEIPTRTPMTTPMPRQLALTLAVVVAVLMSACSSSAPSPSLRRPASDAATSSSASSEAPSLAPTRGPESDLAMLVRTLEGTHPEPYHAVDREEFFAALDAYEAALPSMTASESAVELMRIWAMLSRDRDGHQFALPAAADDFVLPIRVYEFEGDLYVTDAREPNADLAGMRVTAIGGTPIDEVLAAVEPLVPRDGPATVPTFRPVLLLRSVVLEGLGIVEPGEPIQLALESGDGTARSVELEPIARADYAEWAGPFGMFHLPHDPDVAYLADTEPFTVHELDDGRTLYLRYRLVEAPDVDAAESLVRSGGVDRLILDLRQNPGGNNTTYGPLLRLVQAFAADHPDATTVLTDRVTFSAAANLATEIEQSTDAAFMGEPMGGGLNFWNDVSWVDLRTLPIPMRLAVSTRYWQFAAPDDPRLTIEPDAAFPVSAADWLAGRDPVLEAALLR